MPEKCHAIGCSKPAVARKLCNTHYMRQKRHGSTENTRPQDWGARERHPAYKAWCNLRRHHAAAIPQMWRDDFWAFAGEIPEKPSESARAYRPDQDRPWSPTNFYWRESRVPEDKRREQAAYAREWHRASRAANPDYYRDHYFRKKYGVTIAWYREQERLQKGVCAICHETETAVIKGKRISLAVDHCHATQKVRGLLCRSCNNAIGAFRHDTRMLESAIAYLLGETACATFP